MDFTLSPEIEDIRLRVRAFVEEHVLPLEADPAARRSIRLRRPYIDPLSHIQVRYLARLRALPVGDPERERLASLVQLTVNGVAAGLRNTG